MTPLRRAADPITLAEATRRFLRHAFEEGTRVSCGRTLAVLTEVVGAEADFAAGASRRYACGMRPKACPYSTSRCELASASSTVQA